MEDYKGSGEKGPGDGPENGGGAGQPTASDQPCCEGPFEGAGAYTDAPYNGDFVDEEDYRDYYYGGER